MAEERFLILRMGALGDIIHTLPAVSALRESFPRAHIDWLVDRKWHPLLGGNPDVNVTIPMDRTSWGGVIWAVRRLRETRYTCVIDFQSLYRTAILGQLSGAPRRVGFAATYARERGAEFFYTEKIAPVRRHKVEHNLELVESVGARVTTIRFPLKISAEAEQQAANILTARSIRDYFVLSPGGGWRSKCWPAERYGELHRTLAARYGWKGIINFGPGERALAEIASRAAGEALPLMESLDLPPLMALLKNARFVVAADTGPLHLASALGTPVVGLYGPTDPARNGPYSAKDIVVRNATAEETTYRRGKSPAPSMLSITVEQVLDAIGHRLRAN
ncbi:MAG TPA: glycosyltransferase family 9 protein [Candidatus Acidoferrales bacterium]|nr:glycosyltransferase family 9 protein [Candidatus Acidoferrales bacterium]